MKAKKVLISGLVALFLMTSAGCTKKAEKRVVNLAIWSNFLAPDTLERFQKDTGIEVRVSNYSSNEELLAKLQAGASGFDVAVPSDYMVFGMSQLGVLTELNFSLIPNAKGIDAKFLKRSFDPTNHYSVPRDWGTTGIAYNSDLIKTEIKGWKTLFNNPALAGKYTLLDDAREVMGAALKAQGLSLNSKDEASLKNARDLLIKIRKNVKGFTSEPKMALINGESAVAHIFMSDALQAARETGGKIRYVLPEEGGTLWIDNLVIPKGAPHTQEAHELINYLISAETLSNTVKSVLVAPVSHAVFDLLPKELQVNPALFPSAQVISKFEVIEDLGPAMALLDRMWTEVKVERE